MSVLSCSSASRQRRLNQQRSQPILPGQTLKCEGAVESSLLCCKPVTASDWLPYPRPHQSSTWAIARAILALFVLIGALGLPLHIAGAAQNRIHQPPALEMICIRPTQGRVSCVLSTVLPAPRPLTSTGLQYPGLEMHHGVVLEVHLNKVLCIGKIHLSLADLRRRAFFFFGRTHYLQLKAILCYQSHSFRPFPLLCFPL